jgi:hypothetical protein
MQRVREGNVNNFAVDMETVIRVVNVQHACKFDDFSPASRINTQSRCRVVEQCQEQTPCPQYQDCTNPTHKKILAWYHDARNFMYDIYDNKAGFHPTLDPVLHDVKHRPTRSQESSKSSKQSKSHQ